MERIREAFLTLGYTEAAVARLLAGENFLAPQPARLPLMRYLARDDSPLSTLVRLFLLGDAVSVEAIRPLALEAWLEAGLLQIEGGSAKGAARVLPWKDLLLVCDWLERPREDFVMGVGAATLTLANLTIRRRVRAMLDLGAGCGTHALLAAAHSDQVVGVDRNPRAVRLAELSRRLSGADNVQFLEGDLFEPVRGRRFELIVANPPFVISPESRYQYRDSGLGGDRITEEVVRQAPEFLEEGGYCQVLANWIHPNSEDWQERLRRWTAGSGCDAWVMRSHTWEPWQYAAEWNPDRCEEWVSYYERSGIQAISAGLITLRRNGRAPNWFWAGDAPEQMLGPCGEAVLRAFEARDFLEGDLLSARLRVSPDARLEQQCAFAGDGGIAVASQQLRLVRGLAYAGKVDAQVVSLLARLDGHRTLAEALRGLQVSAEEALPVVRSLVERGLLRE